MLVGLPGFIPLIIVKLFDIAEEAEKPADLSQRVVFKKPTKAVNPDVEADSKEAPSCADTKQKNKKEKKAPKPAPSKLSFADEEEPEEEF